MNVCAWNRIYELFISTEFARFFVFDFFTFVWKKIVFIYGTQNAMIVNNNGFLFSLLNKYFVFKFINNHLFYFEESNNKILKSMNLGVLQIYFFLLSNDWLDIFCMSFQIFLAWILIHMGEEKKLLIILSHHNN